MDGRETRGITCEGGSGGAGDQSTSLLRRRVMFLLVHSRCLSG